MTEEKKAENWVKEKCCDWCINADDCKQGCIDCHAITAYLAGLHEGQSKWHKYPDKKPEIGTYLVCYQCENGHRETLELEYSYDKEELHWLDDGCEVFDDKIIAWCEKPIWEGDKK